MENEKKYLRLKKTADLQEYAKRSDVTFLIGGDYHVAEFLRATQSLIYRN